MADAPDVFRMNGKNYVTKIKNGRRWNPQYYFSEALKQAPTYWSPANESLIKAGQMPKPDDAYLKKLGKNLNEQEFSELKASSMRPKTRKKLLGMEHHHLDHGDIAIGLPWNVHRGKGNTKFWHTFKKSGRKFTKKLPVIGTIIALANYDDMSAMDTGDAIEASKMGAVEFEKGVLNKGKVKIIKNLFKNLRKT